MQAEQQSDLLPCPFCGFEPMSTPVESMFHTFRIVCPHCDMCGPERMTVSGAIEAWQARAALSHPSPQWLPIESAPKDGTEIVGAEWQQPCVHYPQELFTQTTKYAEEAWRYPSGVS